jgi:hypothetical protein
MKVRSLGNGYENVLPLICKCSFHVQLEHPIHQEVFYSVISSLCSGKYIAEAVVSLGE